MYWPAHLGAGELEKLLEQETSQAGFFDRPMAGEALKRDNENFAYALFEIMPQSEKIGWYAKLKVPFNPDPRLMQLLAAMLYALPANYMNVSLRLEMTRVSLAEELAAATDPGKLGSAHLGSKLTEFFGGVGKTWGRFVDSLSDFFQELGRTIGEGLRSIGRNVLSFRAALIELGGPAMRYVTDFLILTPGVKFIFGDLSNELGGALMEGRRVQLLPIAAAYAQYLDDMSMILNTASPWLPPPWNMIAKVVAVIYKAGSGVIMWQIAEHVQDIMQRQAEANAVARAELEEGYRKAFRGFEDTLAESGLLVGSEYGANSVSQPAGGLQMGGMILLGLVGLAAVVVLWK